MTSRVQALSRTMEKRYKDKLYQRKRRAKQQQKLQTLESDVRALKSEIARLYQPLPRWKVAIASAILEDHARTIVTRYFSVYQSGYSVSMAPLQEHFLRSILDPDVEGVDLRTANAFIQQWRLNGQYFALYILEPQSWKTQIIGDCVMVTVEVMLYLRFLRQTIGMLFPALKSGDVRFETVLPLTTGTTVVVGTYTFVVDQSGTVISLLGNLQLLESLRRVLRSLDTVVRLTEGTLIALDSGSITLN